MLVHIVILKLKDEAEGQTKDQNLQKLKRDLLDLCDKIPQIRKLEVGIQALSDETASDLAIYSEFENEVDLAIYARHPDHQKVLTFVKKVITERRVVDYYT